MNHNPSPTAAVAALLGLLKTHPELPPASWYIPDSGRELSAHLHDSDLAALHAYAEALGGSIRPGKDYPHAGQMQRPHRLHTTWQTIDLVVVQVLPAPAAALGGAA